MRLSLSRNRNRSPILITLIIVAFLVVYYLLVYIPNNEQEIKNQRFRVLQRIDKNIHDKIDNSVSLLDLLLRSNGGVVNVDSLRSYIGAYPRENFILDKIQREPDAILSKYKKGDRSIDSSGSITGSDEDPVGRIKVDDLKEQFEIIVRRIIRENGFDMATSEKLRSATK